MDPDALLTAEQVGELLQLSPRTLKDQAAAGVLPHHRFGKHYRFSRSDIGAILRHTEHVGKPQHGRLNIA
ncbi:helix-turn-helix domain-containing protein [Actinosynnema sp. NPDC050436]|uniref:helix-turn-helix domain-containing protein n=1 Tax=Actinosynnema sp. NPDC050436 TaxID=3155659 RepID=UPI003403CED2